MNGYRLQVKNIGPVKECGMELDSFNVVTGKQSSGKSTIARCLYIFLSAKDALGKQAFQYYNPEALGSIGRRSINFDFKLKLQTMLEDVFGTSNSAIRAGSFMRMDYPNGFYIQIAVNDSGSVSVSYSYKLRDFIKDLENASKDDPEKRHYFNIQVEVDDFFMQDYSPVYIPAGRSMMTVLGSQFEYFYSTLNDRNKELIDLCTRRFLEGVISFKPILSNGLAALGRDSLSVKVLHDAEALMRPVMKGDYYYSKGEEYLRLEDGLHIGINMASSGQQEALWIYNILLLYTIIGNKKFYIIEEPETNLFPESQQYMAKFLGMIANYGNPMLINTHSPYILGEINNMIYAGEIKKNRKKTYDVIEKENQLRFTSTKAYFVDEGMVTDCMDYDIKQIDNSKLDAISDVINGEFDRLLEIEKGK